SVVAGSFGIGLGASSLLGGSLCVEVLAIRFIALANGIGGHSLGVDSALRFLLCAGLCRGFTAGSRAAFDFGALFVDMLHGDFTCVFRGLHDFTRHRNRRFLGLMLPSGGLLC